MSGVNFNDKSQKAVGQGQDSRTQKITSPNSAVPAQASATVTIANNVFETGDKVTVATSSGVVTDPSTLTYTPWEAATYTVPFTGPPSLPGGTMYMHLISDNRYFKVEWLTWAQGPGGGVPGTGAFSYTRTEIIGGVPQTPVTFVRPPSSPGTTDDITAAVHIKRNNSKGIFNSVIETVYDDVTWLSPLDTEWAVPPTPETYDIQVDLGAGGDFQPSPGLKAAGLVTFDQDTIAPGDSFTITAGGIPYTFVAGTDFAIGVGWATTYNNIVDAINATPVLQDLVRGEGVI